MKGLVLIFQFLCSLNLYALVPVESLVLGSFKESYIEHSDDPINLILGQGQRTGVSIDFKKELAIYRGHYEEGKNLVNSCKNPFPIRYVTEWEKVQAKRTVISGLQYVGLDLLTRAIPQYAKALDFKEDEYKNLVNNLVGNYCSQNLTVISIKELKNNLLLKYEKENNFVLPNVAENPLYPTDLEKYRPMKKARELEFKHTIRLFKALCSWGGDPDQPNLLVPLLKHGAIMAHLNRLMNAKDIAWNSDKNELSLIDTKNGVHVLCENLICRRADFLKFKVSVPLSVGGTSFYQDFKFLYCDSFQLVDYNTKEGDPKIIKMMKDMTFDDENFLVSQFNALITGVPDFLLGVERFSDGEDLLRSSMDFSFDKWAKEITGKLDRDLFFEEPLTLELIDRSLYFNKQEFNFRLGLDVNLGEIDRINQKVGKLVMKLKLKLPQSYVLYHKNAITHMDWNYPQEKDRLINRLKLYFEKDLAYYKEALIIPPWKGDLGLLIAKEIHEQIMLLDEKFFKVSTNEMKDISVEINYSPFALRYLNHQFNIDRLDKRDSQMTKDKSVAKITP